jgi:hypothetical protein
MGKNKQTNQKQTNKQKNTRFRNNNSLSLSSGVTPVASSPDIGI